MKSFPKIFTIFFLIVFILQLAVLLYLSLAPNASQAADIQFKPQVEIPGYTFIPGDKTTGNIANLVRAIYKYAIGIVGILAAVVLMIGGVMWIVAGGNATAIGEAKAWIGASLTGLLLALMSYLILATVNPALVNLKTSGIQTIENNSVGCCQEDNSCSMIPASSCQGGIGTWMQDYICGGKECMKISTFDANTNNDCKTKSGRIFGMTGVNNTQGPINLCKGNCAQQNKQISNKSFYISAGQGYLFSYCCICE